MGGGDVQRRVERVQSFEVVEMQAIAQIDGPAASNVAIATRWRKNEENGYVVDR